MSTGPSTAHSHEHPFRGFDRSIERVLGADVRLIYGFAVPVLMVCGLIVLLGLNPSTWLVIAIVLLEVAALVLVVFGFMGMLNEPDDSDAAEH